MFEPFLIVVFESINCPQCEKMDLKSYSHCWKGFKYAKMLENCRIYRTWRICLKNSAQFNCQNKQGTHEQPTQNKRTVVDHPGNLTQY